MLAADEALEDELKLNVQDNLNPKQRGGRQSRYDQEIFDQNRIIYEKYFVNKKLRNILIDFEDYASCARNGGTISKMRDESEDKDEDIRSSIVQEYLKEIASKYQKKCWAIPLNSSLISLDQIWEMVKCTRMHEIDNQSVEFSLSVMLKAYPSNVISVWIYLAVFTEQEGYE